MLIMQTSKPEQLWESYRKLLKAVAEEVMERQFKGFNQQAVSNLCWGFATLNHRHPPFMLVLCQALFLVLGCMS